MKSLLRERMTGADLGFDVVLLLIVVTLLAAGLITVASTSWGVSYTYSDWSGVFLSNSSFGRSWELCSWP